MRACVIWFPLLPACAHPAPVAEPIAPTSIEIGLIALHTSDGLRTLRISPEGLAPVGPGVLRPHGDGLAWLDVQTVRTGDLHLDLLRTWPLGAQPPALPTPAPGSETATLELRFVGPTHLGLRSSGSGSYGGPHPVRWDHLLVLPWPAATWSAARALRTEEPGKGAQPAAIDGLLGERAAALAAGGERDVCDARDTTTWTLTHRAGAWVVEASALSQAHGCGAEPRVVTVGVPVSDALVGHAQVASAPILAEGASDEVWSPGGQGVRVHPDRVALVRGGEEVASVPWSQARVVSVAWTADPAQVPVWAALGEP
jgi:hypothetical protein